MMGKMEIEAKCQNQQGLWIKYFLLSQVLMYNHGQKQLRHSPKKTCSVKSVSFSISSFHISTPSPLFNVVTT